MPEQDVFQNEVEVEADLPQTAEVRQYVSSVSVGNVTTLPAGSQATVENVGTEENAIFDFGLPKGDAGSMWGELSGDIGDQADLSEILTNQEAAINVKAPLSSPALTGTPTAPTAVDGTNTAQIATTAFVSNAVTNLNNTLQTYVQNYVQNYVNQAVANMLKTMNFFNAVNFDLSPNNAAREKNYLIPTNGYIIFATLSAPNANCVLIGGHDLYRNGLSAGVPYPITGGTTITAKYASGGVGQAIGVFVPFTAQ